MLSKNSVQVLARAMSNRVKTHSLQSLSVSRTNVGGSKLRTYAKFKHTAEIENYLTCIDLSWKQKRVISKFRLSNHKLHIETGRYCRPRLPPERRTCNVCSLNATEDEPHFLIVCPLYAHLRQKHCIDTPVCDTNADIGAVNADNTNIIGHFVEIMTSHDTSVLQRLSNFLSEAFSVRDTTICELGDD